MEPKKREEFELADGRILQRDVGEARFYFDGKDAASPVIFGQEGDASVLGVVTLEAMGLTGEMNYNVTLDPSMISGQNEYAIAGAHEGTHIADINDPRFANPDTTLSPFQQEYRAYQTSIFAASALGVSSFSAKYGGNSYELWNGSWKAVDKNIANLVTSFRDGSGRQTHPDTKPNEHNPWPN